VRRRAARLLRALRRARQGVPLRHRQRARGQPADAALRGARVRAAGRGRDARRGRPLPRHAQLRAVCERGHGGGARNADAGGCALCCGHSAGAD
jgi:hypothetical protein